MRKGRGTDLDHLVAVELRGRGEGERLDEDLRVAPRHLGLGHQVPRRPDVVARVEHGFGGRTLPPRRGTVVPAEAARASTAAAAAATGGERCGRDVAAAGRSAEGRRVERVVVFVQRLPAVVPVSCYVLPKENGTDFWREPGGLIRL